jgi:hypothetical protein
VDNHVEIVEREICSFGGRNEVPDARGLSSLVRAGHDGDRHYACGMGQRGRCQARQNAHVIE